MLPASRSVIRSRADWIMRRAAARAIDFVLAFLILWPPILFTMRGGHLRTHGDPAPGLILLATTAVIEIGALCRWGGTPGKLIMRLRVRHSDGSNPNVFQALIRTALVVGSVALLVIVVNAICTMLWGAPQWAHDLLTQTRTVDERTLDASVAMTPFTAQKVRRAARIAALALIAFLLPPLLLVPILHFTPDMAVQLRILSLLIASCMGAILVGWLAKRDSPTVMALGLLAPYMAIGAAHARRHSDSSLVIFIVALVATGFGAQAGWIFEQRRRARVSRGL